MVIEYLHFQLFNDTAAVYCLNFSQYVSTIKKATHVLKRFYLKRAIKANLLCSENVAFFSFASLNITQINIYTLLTFYNNFILITISYKTYKLLIANKCCKLWFVVVIYMISKTHLQNL